MRSGMCLGMCRDVGLVMYVDMHIGTTWNYWPQASISIAVEDWLPIVAVDRTHTHNGHMLCEQHWLNFVVEREQWLK